MSDDDGYGSRSEPRTGSWYERPTQIIGELVAARLPVVGQDAAADAIRHALQHIDAETWRRAWEIWAPHRRVNHPGSDRWTGGDRKDEP